MADTAPRRTRLRAFFRRHRGLWIGLLVFALLFAPIPCKRAVDLETEPMTPPEDLDALVGSEVTVLCQHTGIAVTDPDDDYLIVGIEQDGVLREWEDPHHGGPVIFLSVSPAWFLGYGARACYEQGSNRFLFRGVLEWDEYGGYHLRLDSWDIAAPVHRSPVYRPLLPRPAYFERWLFLFDFWYPNAVAGLY